MNRYRSAIVVGAAAAAAVVAVVGFNSTVSANDIVISIDGATGGAEGDVILLNETPVPDEFVGATCEATLRAENNSSVHPNNDLIISGGENTVRLENVEDAPGNVVSGSGPAILGDTIRVEMQLGPDGRTSGGFTLEFDCEPLAPPTTVPPETTTTVPPETTTPAPPETTTPPPETTTPAPPVTTTPESPVDPPVPAEPDFTG